MQGALAGHTYSHIHIHPHIVHIFSNAALRYQWALWWMFQSRNQPLKRRAGRPKERRAEGRPAAGSARGRGWSQEGAWNRRQRASLLLLTPQAHTELRAAHQPALTLNSRERQAELPGRMAQNSVSAPARGQGGWAGLLWTWRGPGPTRHHVHDLSHEAGQRRGESRRKQAWARDVAENNGHNPGWRRGTRLQDLMKRTSSHWCPDHPYLKPKQNTRFLSPLLLSLRLLPPPPAFQGDSKLTRPRLAEFWLNSISVSTEHLSVQCSHCLWPCRWDSAAENFLKDCGRHLEHHQAGSEQGCPHWLPYTGTHEGRNVREQPVRCIFPLAYGTFYFPNGLRSDRNTARHAESPPVEGLQHALWAPESLICMKVHRTISPCNTLPRRKNQCPRAHKDEYRAFQLSFFSKNISLFKRIQKAIWYCFHFSLRCWVYARISTGSIPLGRVGWAPENTVG